MAAAVEVSALTKAYGAVLALSDLDLSIPRGGVFGLLGPNGAGKSTLLRLVLGLVRASAGELRVLGRTLARGAPRGVGALIEAPRFHPWLTGAETLEALALTAGAAPATRRLLELVGLSDAAALRTDAYSLGMKQRLAIACALIGEPELVILDEPLNGLDPAGIIEMRGLIRRLGEDEGVTVIVSSHLLGEVEKVCGRIAILDRGRLVREGTVESLLAGQSRLRIRATPVEAALELAGAAAVRDGDAVSVAVAEAEAPALIAALCAQGVAVYEARWERPSLEELFLKETGR